MKNKILGLFAILLVFTAFAMPVSADTDGDGICGIEEMGVQPPIKCSEEKDTNSTDTSSLANIENSEFNIDYTLLLFESEKDDCKDSDSNSSGSGSSSGVCGVNMVPSYPIL